LPPNFGPEPTPQLPVYRPSTPASAAAFLLPHQKEKIVPAGDSCAVSYFSKKHGMKSEQAREIIKKHRPSRADADAAAERLKS
jgi:hypothetical protein